MKKEYIDPIKNHPQYIKLVSERKRLALILSSIVLVVYFSFILTIAFSPATLATPIYDGSVISVGIPVGIIIIIISVVSAGIYVSRANALFDDYIEQIQRDVLHG